MPITRAPAVRSGTLAPLAHARGALLEVRLLREGVVGVEGEVVARRRVHADRRVEVGGQGARGVRRGPRGVDYFRDLITFEGWLRKIEKQG